MSREKEAETSRACALMQKQVDLTTCANCMNHSMSGCLHGINDVVEFARQKFPGETLPIERIEQAENHIRRGLLLYEFYLFVVSLRLPPRPFKGDLPTKVDTLYKELGIDYKYLGYLIEAQHWLRFKELNPGILFEHHQVLMLTYTNHIQLLKDIK